MGREIKFRGLIRFGKDSGKWKYVILGEGAIGTAMSDLSIYLNNEDCLISSLSQFTGLKDKNEKEIYEGDILKVNCKMYFVEWNEDVAGFILTTGKGYNTSNMLDFNYDSIYYSEIIGNTHENAELLK